jgi:hypothetical protein
LIAELEPQPEVLALGFASPAFYVAIDIPDH